VRNTVQLLVQDTPLNLTKRWKQQVRDFMLLARRASGGSGIWCLIAPSVSSQPAAAACTSFILDKQSHPCSKFTDEMHDVFRIMVAHNPFSDGVTDDIF
jgi:hypothetical protein